MNVLISVIAIIVAALLGAVILLIYVLTSALLKSVNRVNMVNSQLLLLIAGKDQKPETLRALVAHDRKPGSALAGVAAGIVKDEKEEKKSKNKDYVMTVGGNR